MTHTYTPLTIEGKIYVVVDAPEKPDFADYDNMRRDYSEEAVVSAYQYDVRRYYSRIATCTKYETLPEHAPYWKERIGQRVEVEFETENEPVGYAADAWRDVTYAIPPQQKQGDEWDEAYDEYIKFAAGGPDSESDLLEFLKSRYNPPTKK